MMEVKALLEAAFGRTCTSKEILGAARTEGLNLELTEWVGEGSTATTSIKDKAPKLDLKMSNKCAVWVFDEMLERDDKVKVDRHFNAVCGDSNEVQNSIPLSEIVDYVHELLMLFVVETLTADGLDNALLGFHLPVHVLFQLPKVIASSPSIGISNPNLSIVPKVIKKPNKNPSNVELIENNTSLGEYQLRDLDKEKVDASRQLRVFIDHEFRIFAPEVFKSMDVIIKNRFWELNDLCPYHNSNIDELIREIFDPGGWFVDVYIKPSPTHNALIDMYSKCGYRDNAWVVLKVTDNRSIVSWTKMTMKCTQNGQVREAFNTLDEMVAKELCAYMIQFHGHVGMVDATDVNEDDVVYVLRYFHGGKFVSSPKFDYVDWKVDRLQVDPDRLCYWDIIRNVSAFGVDLYVACLEEVDTINGGNAVVGSNVAGSSYDHEDHVVGQEHVKVEVGGRDAENIPQHVEVGPEGEDVRPKLAENEPQIGDNKSIDGNGLEDVDVGPDAENGPEIVDNESSEDNGSEHVELGPEITDIWENHVDVDVGAGVADVNGNGADHVDVDDNGNGADHVDVRPDSKNGSQHAENGLDSDNGLDHVDIGPEVNDVEPELGDDMPELADDGTTDDNGAEDGLDGSEEDAFLFNIDIGSDVDEEVEDIRKKGRGKRHKEKAADREHAADREGQPVQPDNVDEGYRSSDKDGKLEGYETDYISSSDPGEYEDSEQSDDDAPIVRQSLLPRYDPNCVIPVWELGLRFDDNKQFKEAVRKYAFAKGVQLKIVKNEPNRTRFHCMKGCPWTLFASTDKKLRCYTVKTYNHVHKCYRTNKNKLIYVKYIQKQFKDIILANPKMKVKTLKEICKRELGVYASFNMCQRARKQVIKEVRESYVEEYANLWGYAAELLKSNPGSTNVASSTTGPPEMVHGTPQNVASPTTQNVASATTGPPGMVHGTTHNVALATRNPPGMVHSTTQNVASTISHSSNQNLASVSTVAPTTQPKPIKKTYKKKAQVGIDLYTDMKTGDQI
ncbi:hypothetical protein V6N11_011191 [Hibiscus sabdariffa]|uniref:Transposase MuDR plant domain-containing protein n=1 Tax=Hibiscus sabdariffa TaxID=183260 RepID=A0ABR2S7H0_9ROSI